MTTRVTERRAETRRQILAAAWELAARDGIVALSLRDLAGEVGMRAPSLYTYFDSKNAIYDSLFADGYHELDERMRRVVASLPDDASRHALLTSTAEAFLDFCIEHPARYQLLFTHAVPGWQPSEEAYSASLASYGWMVGSLAAQGVEDPPLVDLYTAIVSGLAAQQIANDPGGTRWRDLVADAMRMFLDHVDRRSAA